MAGTPSGRSCFPPQETSARSKPRAARRGEDGATSERGWGTGGRPSPTCSPGGCVGGGARGQSGSCPPAAGRGVSRRAAGHAGRLGHRPAAHTQPRAGALGGLRAEEPGSSGKAKPGEVSRGRQPSARTRISGVNTRPTANSPQNSGVRPSGHSAGFPSRARGRRVTSRAASPLASIRTCPDHSRQRRPERRP